MYIFDESTFFTNRKEADRVNGVENGKNISQGYIFSAFCQQYKLYPEAKFATNTFSGHFIFRYLCSCTNVLKMLYTYGSMQLFTTVKKHKKYMLKIGTHVVMQQSKYLQ